MSKNMDICCTKKNLKNIYRKESLSTATKTWLDALKTASKNKAVHKAAKSTEFIANKIADKIVKPKPASDENLTNVEEIIIPLEKTL